jgi:hypothetical protein
MHQTQGFALCLYTELRARAMSLAEGRERPHRDRHCGVEWAATEETVVKEQFIMVDICR